MREPELMQTALAWRSALPGTIAGVQDVPAAVLVASVSIVAVQLSDDTETAVATAFALVICASLASGAVLYLVGCLGLGRVVRFFPHAVIAGFLASTGLVLFSGGLLMVVPGGHATPDTFGAAFPAILALTTGITLTVATRVVPHSAMTLAVLCLITAAFYLAILLLPGFSLEGAREAGLLARSTLADGAVMFDPRILLAADWSEVAGALPAVGVVVALSLFATLLQSARSRPRQARR